MEGTTWESLVLAGMFHLDNLEVHIDDNGQGALGKTPSHCSRIVSWFGWQKDSVKHHMTTKGAGLSFLTGRMDNHNHTLTEDEYHQALEELK